jgi:hypothetical protein
MKQVLRYLFVLVLAAPCTAQDYCELSCECDEYISRVILETIDNSSTCVPYSDYTYLSTTLTGGTIYQVTVEIGSAWSGDRGAAWIDFNHNYEFDPEEQIMEGAGYGPYLSQFTVPVSAVGGLTLMRVRLCFNQTPYPCGDCNYGEVEDYSITIEGLMCGDADGNGIVNISDAVFLISYIFGGGPAPDPYTAGDADCNGIVNISDAVYLIAYIFGGGSAPCATCE